MAPLCGWAVVGWGGRGSRCDVDDVRESTRRVACRRRASTCRSVDRSSNVVQHAYASGRKHTTLLLARTTLNAIRRPLRHAQKIAGGSRSLRRGSHGMEPNFVHQLPKVYRSFAARMPRLSFSQRTRVAGALSALNRGRSQEAFAQHTVFSAAFCRCADPDRDPRPSAGVCRGD
jgi:hypothetical protein